MNYFNDLLYLVPLLFIAGVLDGIAGGGGIIALPAYMLTGMPVHSAYACNKMQSMLGTLSSGLKYAKEGLVDFKTSLITLPFAVFASFVSTNLIINLNSEKLKVIIAVCIPVAVIMMFLKRKITSKPLKKHIINTKTVLLSMLSGAVLGAYDALFGPGGGTIAMIVFSLLLNYDLRVGCGNGKIVIVVSNITAMISYIINGHMIYHIALPCAIANMAGGYIGAVYVVKKGEKVVFPAMLTVIFVLIFQVILTFAKIM